MEILPIHSSVTVHLLLLKRVNFLTFVVTTDVCNPNFANNHKLILFSGLAVCNKDFSLIAANLRHDKEMD